MILEYKDLTRLYLLVPILICTSPATASSVNDSYINGTVKDITSIHGALLVRMDDDRVPVQCKSSGSYWMKIDQSDSAMVSTFLTYWSQGKTSFTIYIDNWNSGYCSISQVDPLN